MTRIIVPTTNPHILHLRFIDTLDLEDIADDESLRLNANQPVFVLADITALNVWLPDGFIESARECFFVNPNVQHLAVVTCSPLLKTAALMVAKITGRREKISFHETIPAAESHLQRTIRRHRLR